MIAVLLALVVTQGPVPSDTTRWLNDSEVRSLCTLPVTGQGRAIAAVQAFCDLRVTTRGDTNVDSFRLLATATFSFDSAGVRVTLPVVAAQDTAAPILTVAAALSTTATATANATAAGSRGSAVWWGLTDFVIGRAQLQFQTWVLPRLSRRVCGPRLLLLTPTSICSILQDTSTAWTAGSGGVLARIGAAARADFKALPARLDTLLANRLPGGGTAEGIRQRKLNDDFRQLLASVVAGDDPDQAVDAVRGLASTQVAHRELASPMDAVIAARTRLQAHEARIRLSSARVRADMAAAAAPGAATDGPTLAARRAQIAEAVWQLATAAADTRLDSAPPGGPVAVRREAIRTIEVNVTAGDFWQALSGLSALLNDPTVSSALGGADAIALLGRLAFLADLAQSPSPEAVRSALMTYAAPPATFLTKRSRSRLTIYLNAYLGGAVGVEGVRQSGVWMNSLAVAPYLPVGLEIDSPRLPRIRCLGRLTVGLLLQVVDLGALASWRLGGDDTVSRTPEVGLRQVFSPGAYLLIHLADLPVTLGGGVAYTPSLRTIENTDVTARRLGGFIAFDVPLFEVRFR
jgi:hypothetical protein